MLCLTCSTETHPGGTTYGAAQAVAVCRSCGAGVCARHLRRLTGAAACACPACAGATATPIAHRDVQEIRHAAV